MLKQVQIIDTITTDPILQETYLVNGLVNSQDLSRSFYEMYLLLKHQKGEFKRFCTNRNLFLQISDEMFCFYVLLVNALRKVKLLINQVIVSRQKAGWHVQKDYSFDIFSLTSQLHQSLSTDPKSPKQRNIYFSENQVLDLQI